MSEGRNVLNSGYAKQIADKLASSVPVDFDHVKDWLNSTFRTWFIENAPARRVVLADHFLHVLEIGDIVYGARVRQSEREISMRVCLVEFSRSPEWLQKAFQSYTPVYALSPLATLPCEVLTNLECPYTHSDDAVIAQLQEEQKKVLHTRMLTALEKSEEPKSKAAVRRIRKSRAIPDEDIDDPGDCEYVNVATAVEYPINIDLPPEPEPYDKAKTGVLDWCHWKLDTFTHFVDYLLTLPKKQLKLTVPHLLDQVHAWDKRLHSQKLIQESEKDTEPIASKFLDEFEGGVTMFGKNVGGDKVEYKSADDLKGHTVGAVGGSVVDARVLNDFLRLGMKVQPFDDNAKLFDALTKGQIDAAVVVAGAPSTVVDKLPNGHFKFLPIRPNQDLANVYEPTKVQYTNVSEGKAVDTISTRALVVSRTFRSPEMLTALAKLRACFVANVPKLQDKDGTHPKWQDVDPTLRGKWDWYDLPTVAGATPAAVTAPAMHGKKK